MSAGKRVKGRIPAQGVPEKGIVEDLDTVSRLEAAITNGRDEALLGPQADGVPQRGAHRPANAAELALELVPVANRALFVEGEASRTRKTSL